MDSVNIITPTALQTVIQTGVPEQYRLLNVNTLNKILSFVLNRYEIRSPSPKRKQRLSLSEDNLVRNKCGTSRN